MPTTSSSTLTPESSKTTPSTALSPVPNLVDFLNSVPPHLTLLLVNLAPHASHLRYFAEVASWRRSWYDSWIALALWWMCCTFIDLIFRYFVPIIILIYIAFLRKTQNPRSAMAPLVTEHAIQASICDFTVLETLLPGIPPVPPVQLPNVTRLIVLTYIPYLLITSFVPLRLIIAIAGSILLIWRAPWAVVLRSKTWSSAWFRWSMYEVWAIISGLPLPPSNASGDTTSIASAATSSPKAPAQPNSIRFLFTVYENQRWWMGLDWTAALLPNERPSWCSVAQQPVSPPNAFNLPDETIIYVPHTDGRRIKRTARWHWEELEWRVIIHKDGIGLSRVEKPLPSATSIAAKDREDSSTSKLLRVAGKLNASHAKEAHSINYDDYGSHFTEDPDNEDGDISTDPEGWVYGDNKWEARGPKGGMGKYTRYRRWTRIAVVEETIEIVGEGEVGIQRHHTLSLSESGSQPDEDRAPTPPALPITTLTQNKSAEPLRQRLRALTARGSSS